MTNGDGMWTGKILDQYRIDVTLATMYNIIERGGRYSSRIALVASMLCFLVWFCFVFLGSWFIGDFWCWFAWVLCWQAHHHDPHRSALRQENQDADCEAGRVGWRRGGVPATEAEDQVCGAAVSRHGEGRNPRHRHFHQLAHPGPSCAQDWRHLLAQHPVVCCKQSRASHFHLHFWLLSSPMVSCQIIAIILHHNVLLYGFVVIL